MRSIDISRLDLSLLVVFDAIYREKNVSWAARTLGKSQPNVSAALSRLRNVFQDPLFVRNGAGVKATDRAEELGPSICVALEQRLFSDEHVFAFRADHPEIGETIAPKELARLRVGRSVHVAVDGSTHGKVASAGRNGRSRAADVDLHGGAVRRGAERCGFPVAEARSRKIRPIGAAFPGIAPRRALAARRLRHMSVERNKQPRHAAADWNCGFKIKQVTIVSRVIQVQ